MGRDPLQANGAGRATVEEGRRALSKVDGQEDGLGSRFESDIAGFRERVPDRRGRALSSIAAKEN